MTESENQSTLFSPEYLGELIKAISAGAPEKVAEAPPKSEEAKPPVGDLLSALASDPELISRLPSMIAAAKPIIEMLGAAGRSEGQKSEDGAVATGALLAKSPPRSSPEGDSRAALLCAMKPYLRADRRQAIDYIVKLGRLGDILKTL